VVICRREVGYCMPVVRRDDGYNICTRMLSVERLLTNWRYHKAPSVLTLSRLCAVKSRTVFMPGEAPSMLTVGGKLRSS
jgi:hypothetical protein